MSIIKFDANICILSGKRGINQVYIDTIMVIELSRILVGIDGSEEFMRAAEYAVSIAKLYNAELIAINVLTPDIGYVYSSPGVESPPLTVREIILLAEDEARLWFNKIKKKAQMTTEVIVAKRSVLSTVLEYVIDQKIDLIVVVPEVDQALRKCYLAV
jgi:nucleotide-binding universal stress UspA family protein